jgi:hypothetical protein
VADLGIAMATGTTPHRNGGVALRARPDAGARRYHQFSHPAKIPEPVGAPIILPLPRRSVSVADRRGAAMR